MYDYNPDQAKALIAQSGVNMASLPTSPAPEVGLEIPVPQSDQGELDQMRADVKRFGAEYERIADELGLSREDRLAWRHYLD